MLLALPGCGSRAPAPPAPRQIRLVGSPAGLPFAAAAAETVARASARTVAPLARAGGTGAGIAAFCRGLGARHPDLVLATRAPSAAESARCTAHGVARVATVPIGWSALVLLVRRDSPLAGVSRAALWRALATPAATWQATDPRLPARPILFDGPITSPALADGLFDRLLLPGCAAARPPEGCGTAQVRRDGRYRSHGADPALAVAAALAAPEAVAIVPYAEAVRHADAARLLPLDGVAPTADTIASGRYPARLPLLLLVKAGEAPAVPALPALLRAVAAGLGPGGGFASLGLVPLPAPEAARSAARLRAIAAGRVTVVARGGSSPPA